VPYDSTATLVRLLDAAYAEFVERGLAGARVERIAAKASANKQAIYAYFGSKDALFDAVLSQRLGVLADAVPFTPRDLASYATAMFDYLLDHPDHMRLTMWRRLERPAGTEAEIAVYSAKVDALVGAYKLDGDPGTALDLLVLTLGAATAWASTATEIRGLAGGPDAAARVARHRRAVHDTVAAGLRAISPGSRPRRGRTD
jgi:AcrR family transcriptional regulator